MSPQSTNKRVPMMVPPARQSAAPEAAVDPLAVWAPSPVPITSAPNAEVADHPRRELAASEIEQLDAIEAMIVREPCAPLANLALATMSARRLLPIDAAETAVVRWGEVIRELLLCAKRATERDNKGSRMAAEIQLEEALELIDLAGGAHDEQMAVFDRVAVTGGAK